MSRLLPLLPFSIMEMLLLLALCVSLSAAEQPLRHVSGALNSLTNLTTNFPPHNVKDMTWMSVNNGIRTRIAKIKDDIMVENLSDRYKQFYNGTVLGIDNLTINDLGLYIADVTYSDDTSDEMKFNVTLPVTEPTPAVGNSTDQKKEHSKEQIKNDYLILIIILVIVGLLAVTVIVVVILAVWKHWKRSLNTTKQDDRKEDRRSSQNGNVVKGHENNDQESKENFPTPDEETSVFQKLAKIYFSLFNKETQETVFYGPCDPSDKCSAKSPQSTSNLIPPTLNSAST